MPRKKTNDEFINELNSINNNIEVIGVYKNTYTKIKCKCKKHNIVWDVRPDSLLKGAGCDECKKEKIGSQYRRTNEEFLKLLSESNPNIKPLENYINNNTKIRCLCLVCNHEWHVRPNELLSGKQCTYCTGYRKKTPAEFREEISHLTNNEYLVIDDYINNSTKILFKHNIESCGHEFKTKPNTFLNGCRCPKCAKENVIKKAKINGRKNRKTHEEFKKEIFDLVNNEYDILSEYNLGNEKIKMRHNICNNDFFITPTSFLGGRRCPFCTKENYRKRRYKGIETFKKEIFELTNDEYILVDNEYKNAHTKMLFLHNIKKCGKEFFMTPNDFLVGNRCPFCKYIKNGIKSRKSQEQFEKEVEKLTGDEYLIIGKYTKTNEKIKMKHNNCGREFDIFPSWFLQGHGCPYCTKENVLRNITKSQDEFEYEVKTATNDNYSVVGKYINTHTEIELKHNYCNTIFKVKPTMFLSAKVRCPICTKNSNGETVIRQYLDYLNINYDVHKTFPDLLGLGGGHLSYDFYIKNLNLLIEYQGKQHDKPIEYFGGQKQFKIQQEHDKRKREYAKEHNIELLEIWYYDFDNITDILNEKFDINDSFEDLVVG